MERDVGAGRLARVAGTIGLIAGCAASLGGADEPPRPDAGSPAITLDFHEPPRVLKQTKPRYPQSAFELRLELVVEVELLIDPNGRVAAARVRKPKKPPKKRLEAATNDLYEAALTCVREWEFEPARKDGRPVTTIARAPIGFRIWGDKKKTPAPQP
jgi:protein TonB